MSKFNDVIWTDLTLGIGTSRAARTVVWNGAATSKKPEARLWNRNSKDFSTCWVKPSVLVAGCYMSLSDRTSRMTSVSPISFET